MYIDLTAVTHFRSAYKVLLVLDLSSTLDCDEACKAYAIAALPQPLYGTCPVHSAPSTICSRSYLMTS